MDLSKMTTAEVAALQRLLADLEREALGQIKFTHGGNCR